MRQQQPGAGLQHSHLFDIGCSLDGLFNLDPGAFMSAHTHRAYRDIGLQIRDADLSGGAA